MDFRLRGSDRVAAYVGMANRQQRFLVRRSRGGGNPHLWGMGKDVLSCYTVSRGGAVTRENDVATWIYVVHLTRPEAVSSPTEEESAAIDGHFVRLQQACSAGTVRLAGRWHCDLRSSR